MVVREMLLEDLPALIELQEAGAVVGLATVFDQERFPFPRETIIARWRDELADPAIKTYVAVGNDSYLLPFENIVTLPSAG